MKTVLVTLFAIVVLSFAALDLFLVNRRGARTTSDEIKRMNEVITVLDEIMAAADKAIPRGILESMEGIAVFPSLIKGGFIVGGSTAVASSACATRRTAAGRRRRS